MAGGAGKTAAEDHGHKAGDLEPIREKGGLGPKGCDDQARLRRCTPCQGERIGLPRA